MGLGGLLEPFFKKLTILVAGDQSHKFFLLLAKGQVIQLKDMPSQKAPETPYWGGEIFQALS